jgi:hypothetical protein
VISTWHRDLDYAHLLHRNRWRCFGKADITETNSFSAGHCSQKTASGHSEPNEGWLICIFGEIDHVSKQHTMTLDRRRGSKALHTMILDRRRGSKALHTMTLDRRRGSKALHTMTVDRRRDSKVLDIPKLQTIGSGRKT